MSIQNTKSSRNTKRVEHKILFTKHRKGIRTWIIELRWRPTSYTEHTMVRIPMSTPEESKYQHDWFQFDNQESAIGPNKSKSIYSYLQKTFMLKKQTQNEGVSRDVLHIRTSTKDTYTILPAPVTTCRRP